MVLGLEVLKNHFYIFYQIVSLWVRSEMVGWTMASGEDPRR